MIIVEHVLGNAKKDDFWKERLNGARIDVLTLSQWEAQKSRCRKQTEHGLDIGISLDRDAKLEDGDVLLWDQEAHMAVVVYMTLRDVMIIDLQQLATESNPETIIRTAFELGHALGNQHWKSVFKNNCVYIPLTTANNVMESVLRTHGFQNLPHRFIKGEEVLSLLTNSESRLLFGGAEEADRHVHVESDHNHAHGHDHGHSHGHH